MFDLLNAIFPSTTDLLNVIIMAFFLGAVIAGFLILYQKRALGKLVRGTDQYRRHHARRQRNHSKI